MPKRRVLLVDDEVAVLLTMKAVLEIAGFDVETAASAREAKLKIRSHQYEMVITDMRMESDVAGSEVIQSARTAPYHPAVALLTAYPLSDDDWQDMGADKMLVKPMQTAILLRQIETLLASHSAKLAKIASAAAPPPRTAAKKSAAKRLASKKLNSPAKGAAKKSAAKKTSAKTAKKAVKPTRKPAVRKPVAKKLSASAKPARKTAARPAPRKASKPSSPKPRKK